jgi:nucleoside-diphosphate-sugar epimerase
VSDVARALEYLLFDFESGCRVYNVGTGTPRSVRDVVDCVSQALGSDIEIVQDENRVRESDRPCLLADCARLQREFNWEPSVDFVDGLSDLIKHTN